MLNDSETFIHSLAIPSSKQAQIIESNLQLVGDLKRLEAQMDLLGMQRHCVDLQNKDVIIVLLGFDALRSM